MSNHERSFLFGFFGGVLVIGVILGLYVNSFAPTNTAENITAVVSVLALIVSSVAVFYVYKTYQSQSEELKESKRDAEYSRVLDITFKQIQLVLPKIFDDRIYIGLKKLSQDYQIQDYVMGENYLQDDLYLVEYVYETFHKINSFKIIIETNNSLEESDRQFLRDIVQTNLGKPFFDVMEFILQYDKKHNKDYTLNQERLESMLEFKTIDSE